MLCRRLVTGLLACLLAQAAPARAQQTLDEIEAAQAKDKQAESAEPKRPIAQVNGYIDNRFAYSYIDPNVTPVPTQDTPSLQEILEGNVQLKVNLGSKAFVYTDISLIYQNGWLFYDKDGSGGRVQVPDHDVATLHPFVVPSELYVTYSPKPWLNFLVGRKRIVWGSGSAFNPTDLINPPKDPTDPNFQRAGQWLVRVELPFEKFTISALFAPQVLYQASGIPYAMLKYQSCPTLTATTTPGMPTCSAPPDDDFHYLIAGRLYMLLFNSDVNLFYFFSNSYNDAFKNKSRLGASFSRYFFTDYELHAEMLFQMGSNKAVVSDACLNNAAACNPLTALTASKLENGQIYPRILVGGRTMFKDESTLSIEYYYQGDGYSDQEFADFIRLVSLPGVGSLLTSGATGSTTGGSSGALPTRFIFDPLRRHYLIASYTKPKIKDDFTVGATLIAGLNDLSAFFSPTFSWSAKEWLTLSLYGQIPIRGIPVGQAVINDTHISEYSLFSAAFRVLFEVRLFY